MAFPLRRLGWRTHILCYDPWAEKVPDQEYEEVDRGPLRRRGTATAPGTPHYRPVIVYGGYEFTSPKRTLWDSGLCWAEPLYRRGEASPATAICLHARFSAPAVKAGSGWNLALGERDWTRPGTQNCSGSSNLLKAQATSHKPDPSKHVVAVLMRSPGTT